MPEISESDEIIFLFDCLCELNICTHRISQTTHSRTYADWNQPVCLAYSFRLRRLRSSHHPSHAPRITPLLSLSLSPSCIIPLFTKGVSVLAQSCSGSQSCIKGAKTMERTDRFTSLVSSVQSCTYTGWKWEPGALMKWIRMRNNPTRGHNWVLTHCFGVRV